jgi:hypothetical protein
MKRGMLYQRGGVLYLHSSSKTSAGVWIAVAPYLSITSDDVEAKKEAVESVLSASKTDVPHPKEWAGVFEPMLKAANVKSWSTFQKNAKCIELSSDGVKLRLVPNVNLGSKEGFKAKEDEAVEVAHLASASEVAAAVETALSRCE